MITVWSVITVIFQNEFLEISGFEKLLLNFAVFFDKDDLDFFLDHVVELVELVEAVDWKKHLFNFSTLRCENLFFNSTNRKNLQIKVLAWTKEPGQKSDKKATGCRFLNFFQSLFVAYPQKCDKKATKFVIVAVLRSQKSLSDSKSFKIPFYSVKFLPSWRHLVQALL